MALNRKNIFLILSQWGDALKRGQCVLKNSREVILSAYKINSYAFHYASDDLKNDRKFVKELMQINPIAIIHASEEIKRDKDFLADILLEMPEAMTILDIKEDKEFVSEIAKKNGAVLLGLGKNDRVDKEFLSEIIKENPSALLSADPSIRKDKEYIRKMMKDNDNFQVLLYADDSIREDKEFVLELLDSCPRAILYAGEEAKANREFMLKAAEKSTYVSASLKGELINDTEFKQKISNMELNKIKSENSVTSEQLKNKNVDVLGSAVEATEELTKAFQIEEQGVVASKVQKKNIEQTKEILI